MWMERIEAMRKYIDSDILFATAGLGWALSAYQLKQHNACKSARELILEWEFMLYLQYEPHSGMKSKLSL